MEVPTRWRVPGSLPENVRLCWMAKWQNPEAPQPTSTEVKPPLPNEMEPTPPIPTNLQGRECFYGFTVTPELMEAYHAKHSPNEAPPTHYVYLLARNDLAILKLAERLNLDFYLNIEHIEGHNNILSFASTRGGVVWESTVPSALRLEDFARELGIKETAQWLDAIMDARHY